MRGGLLVSSILVKLDSSELLQKSDQLTTASNMKAIDKYVQSKQTKKEPNPSSYYQILENMQEIQNILNSIVVDPDNPNENLGSIIQDVLDRLDQIESEGGGSGSDIDIGNIDTDNPPSFYTKAISYEVKKASSIGLTESVGFDKNTSHAVVITYNNAKVLEDVVGSTLKTFQIAFGNSLVQFYREKNSDTDTWSNWTNNKSEGIEPSRSVSWIFSDSMPEPDEQIENDYWIAPVDI